MEYFSTFIYNEVHFLVYFFERRILKGLRFFLLTFATLLKHAVRLYMYIKNT